jgi:hypothetical protein
VAIDQRAEAGTIARVGQVRHERGDPKWVIVQDPARSAKARDERRILGESATGASWSSCTGRAPPPRSASCSRRAMRGSRRAARVSGDSVPHQVENESSRRITTDASAPTLASSGRPRAVTSESPRRESVASQTPARSAGNSLRDATRSDESRALHTHWPRWRPAPDGRSDRATEEPRQQQPRRAAPPARAARASRQLRAAPGH